MLKGEAKKKYQREYMREYMRRRREAARAGLHKEDKHHREQSEIARPKAELDRERKRKVAKPVRPPVDPDSHFARCRKENQELRVKIKYLTKTFEHKVAEIERRWMMPRETYNAVVKCLHSDARKNMTPKQMDHALGLLTAWKKDSRRS